MYACIEGVRVYFECAEYFVIASDFVLDVKGSPQNTTLFFFLWLGVPPNPAKLFSGKKNPLFSILQPPYQRRRKMLLNRFFSPRGYQSPPSRPQTHFKFIWPKKVSKNGVYLLPPIRIIAKIFAKKWSKIGLRLTFLTENSIFKIPIFWRQFSLAELGGIPPPPPPPPPPRKIYMRKKAKQNWGACPMLNEKNPLCSILWVLCCFLCECSQSSWPTFMEPHVKGNLLTCASWSLSALKPFPIIPHPVVIR